ncbi:hypothetical protein PT974_08241 [Cladobotryum mycophilum]|uniref:Uncharacterized protein n=1 Tax=Cladobotryum mycophilum TaxID=491253 RepID=A0ABR0SCS0_9HYPO
MNSNAMPGLQRSLDDIRLEIVLIAARVLVLVSLLGILILMNVGFKTPSRKQDSESYEAATGWRELYDDTQPDAQPITYHDDETFIESVRRRSLDLAEDFKRELSTFTRKVSAPVWTGHSLNPPSAGSPEYHLLDSSAPPATGRDFELGGAKRRSIRAAETLLDRELEEQDESDSS